MTSLRFSYFVVLLLLATLSSGCGGKNDGDSQQGKNGAQQTKRVAREQLPGLGTEMTKLDGGRVTLSPPENWYVSEPNAKYVARFSLFKKGESSLPLVVVTAEDSPFAKLNNLTEPDLDAFARHMSELVNQRGKVLERVRPMVIGNVPCIRYVKAANFVFRTPKMEKIEGEQQMLQTLQGGRLYTIELRVRKDTIRTHRDAAYAVLASMKFGEGDPEVKVETTKGGNN